MYSPARQGEANLMPNEIDQMEESEVDDWQEFRNDLDGKGVRTKVKKCYESY